MKNKFKDWENNYYKRIDAWMREQGVWISLRYASQSNNGRGIRLLLLIFPLMVSMLCLLLFLVVFGGMGGWFYLGTESFSEKIKKELQVGFLYKTELGLEGVSGAWDNISIKEVTIQGDKSTFFERLQLNGVSIPYALKNIYTPWTVDSLIVSKGDIKIKVGEVDVPSASDSFKSLFVGNSLKKINVRRLDLSWGYGENSQGGIAGTRAEIVQGEKPETWLLHLDKGTFNYGYFKNWNLVSCDVVIDKEQGVNIENLILESPSGTSLKVQGKFGTGEMPQFDGTAQLSHMTAEELWGDAVLPYLQWNDIQGKGRLSGSLNSQDGIMLALDVVLSEEAPLTLLNNEVLSALAYLDPQHSYVKMQYGEGTFVLKTSMGVRKVILLENIDIAATQGIHSGLKGDIMFEPFSSAEKSKFMEAYREEQKKDVLKTDAIDREVDKLREDMYLKKLNSYFLTTMDIAVTLPAHIKELLKGTRSVLTSKKGESVLTLSLKGKGFFEDILNSVSQSLREPVQEERVKLIRESPLDQKIIYDVKVLPEVNSLGPSH